jgi:hypothetical protein
MSFGFHSRFLPLFHSGRSLDWLTEIPTRTPHGKSPDAL